MNSINLLGRLVRDPEVKQTNNTKLGKFSVGFNDPYNKDKSNFIDCVVFGKTAEIIGEHLGKGDPILITGRIQQDNWEDKEGNKRSKIVLLVERFSFVPSSSAAKVTTPDKVTVPEEDDIPF